MLPGEAGSPGITRYHWDRPQPLHDAGGWPARDTAYRFAEYARIMFDALSDVDADWFTINEPKPTAFVGHLYAAHAPGIVDPDPDPDPDAAAAVAAVAAVHHQLLGHGLAVQQFRDSGARGRLGAALNLTAIYPTSEEFADSARVNILRAFKSESCRGVSAAPSLALN